MRTEAQQEGLAFLLRGLRGTDLLRGQERLLGEAGDDDGVHVQLLPQLLFVQQLLARDTGPPLVTGRTGGGKLIRALNPGATRSRRFVTWFLGGGVGNESGTVVRWEGLRHSQVAPSG